MSHLEEIFQQGRSAAAAGRFEEAAARYLAFLNEVPSAPQAWNNLGNALVQLRKEEDAVECFRNALSLAPDCFEASCNLAKSLLSLKRWKEAEAAARAALAGNPKHCLPHHFLGLALQAQGQNLAAAESFRSAIRIDPRHAPSYLGLGVALRDLGKKEEAVRCYEDLIAVRPDAADGYNNLANIHSSLGDFDRSLKLLEKAVSLDPNGPEANFNLGCHLLRLGRFEEGWKGYERRRECGVTPTILPDRPFWDGSPLAGKAILLIGEQGHGDSIMAVRYASWVKERGGRVFLRCKEALKELFATVEGVDRVFAEGEEIPEVDAQCLLMSLPGIFRARAETIPGTTPYLSADPKRLEKFRTFANPGKLRVGLCWQGNPRHSNDRNRSFSPENFSSFSRMGHVQFFSLQMPAPAHHMELLRRSLGAVDLSGHFRSFADTAAAIASLDLVISADTSVAHLSGALDKPTWLLLPANGEWRWMQGGATPWYPSMRLYRQKEMGDWGSVFAKVAAHLHALGAMDLGRALPGAKVLEQNLRLET